MIYNSSLYTGYPSPEYDENGTAIVPYQGYPSSQGYYNPYPFCQAPQAYPSITATYPYYPDASGVYQNPQNYMYAYVPVPPNPYAQTNVGIPGTFDPTTTAPKPLYRAAGQLFYDPGFSPNSELEKSESKTAIVEKAPKSRRKVHVKVINAASKTLAPTPSKNPVQILTVPDDGQNPLHGETRLHTAIRYGAFREITRLINRPNVDLQVCTFRGKTPLIYAIHEYDKECRKNRESERAGNFFEIIKLLVQKLGLLDQSNSNIKVVLAEEIFIKNKGVIVPVKNRIEALIKAGVDKQMIKELLEENVEKEGTKIVSLWPFFYEASMLLDS